MWVEDLFYPLDAIMTNAVKTDVNDPLRQETATVVSPHSLKEAVKCLIIRYNNASIIEKALVVNDLNNYKITMDDKTSKDVDDSGSAVGKFFSEHWITILVVILVLALVCVLLYFYGGSVHYLLTWPYHLLCKVVGNSTVTTSMTTAVPHWLFPFLETTVPVETVITAGPGEFVKVVGYLLSAAWTACLGAFAWYFRPKTG
jgi:hypothetical protein